MATLVTAMLFTVVATALASNIHTSENGYENGLGDGTNNNNYVHPYIHHLDRDIPNAVDWRAETWRRTGPQYATTGWKLLEVAQCTQCYNIQHWHATGQPSTNTEAEECRYYAVVSVAAAGLAAHGHPHHYWCG